MALTKNRTAVIADISCTGIRLSGRDLPKEGELLEIRIDRLSAFGVVVRSSATECGVAFDAALPAFQVEELRRRAGKNSANNISVEERCALDQWLLGVSP